LNLNQVTVPARDVALSIAFYEQLGLELIVRALPHYARFVCPVGQALFHCISQKINPPERGSPYILNVRTWMSG
jgi:catechol 2,3-dioxygenase-like lactoylglutathione lyase family enzyme